MIASKCVLYTETQALKEAVEDPLLELAIASETIPENYETLLQIAKSALATSEASMKATVDPHILTCFTAIAPSAAEKPVEKQYFVESSDNDLGGKQ